MPAGAGRVLGVAVAAIDAPRRCTGWRARRAVYTVSADVLVVAATARGRRGLSNRSPGGDERRDNHCRTECCLLTPPHAPILAPCRQVVQDAARRPTGAGAAVHVAGRAR